MSAIDHCEAQKLLDFLLESKNEIFHDVDAVLRKINEFSKRHDLSASLINEEETGILHSALSKRKPENVFEVGTGIGYVSILTTKKLLELEIINCRVYSFEKSRELSAISREIVKLAGYEEYIHIYNDDFSKIEEVFSQNQGFDSIDLLILNKTYQAEYLKDLKFVESIGLIIENSEIISFKYSSCPLSEYVNYLNSCPDSRKEINSAAGKQISKYPGRWGIIYENSLFRTVLVSRITDILQS